MATTNFNIRLDDSLKARSFPVFEQYGITPSQAFKLFLNQVAETKSIPLSFDYYKNQTDTKDYQLSKKGQALLAESVKDLENGDFDTYDNLDDALKAMAGLAK